MTRQEIAALACRIMAVWFLCQATFSIYGLVWLAAFQIPQLISHGYDSSMLAAPTVSGLTGLGYALLGAFLWRKAGRIGVRMTSSDPTPVTSSYLDQKSVLSIAFMAVGALIALEVIPDIIRPFYVVIGTDVTLHSLWSDSRWQARFWTSVTQLAISLWLLLGSRRIANALVRLRRMGGAKPSSDER